WLPLGRDALAPPRAGRCGKPAGRDPDGTARSAVACRARPRARAPDANAPRLPWVGIYHDARRHRREAAGQAPRSLAASARGPGRALAGRARTPRPDGRPADGSLRADGSASCARRPPPLRPPPPPPATPPPPHPP